MIPEVANPLLTGVLEISEEIVRFSKAGGRSHFYFNTEQIFAGVVCCRTAMNSCAVVPETDFEKEKGSGFIIWLRETPGAV